MITITNEDCMELMARYPDGYFDLAIVDPPYGIGEDGSKNIKRTSRNAKARIYKGFAGEDKTPPNTEYFNELFRVSKNQVIWGANYMSNNLPPSMGWIFWDKNTEACDFSDGELAYTSFQRALKKFKYTWNGFRQGPTNQSIETRIHPTQKPVALYKWLLHNYAKPGDRILDTHLGSGSIAIACHDYNFQLTGCELDPDYYEAAMKRLKAHQAQQKLF